MKIKVKLLYKTMHNGNRTTQDTSKYLSRQALKQYQYNIYDILKALPSKNFVKSNEYKFLLKTLSDFDRFNVNESEFQQSIEL